MVSKIQSNQLIELLPDNLALQQHIEAFTGAIGSANQQFHLHSKTKFTEIHTIQSWMNCFLTHMTVRIPDIGTQHMLTYARLILQEAMRHESSGWLLISVQKAAIPPLFPVAYGNHHQQVTRHPESILQICVSWNKGACAYPWQLHIQTHLCDTP